MCFTSLVRSPSRLSLTTCVLHYKPALPLGRAFPSARSHYLSVSLLRINFGSTGISTRCPSSTPFGLDLGPDLPWADEPSPGNLRLSTAEFLAPLSLLMPRLSTAEFLAPLSLLMPAFSLPCCPPPLPIWLLPARIAPLPIHIHVSPSFGVTFEPR